MAWAPDYLSVEDLREYVDVDDLEDDATYAMAIPAASRAVDHHCNRQFGTIDSVVTRLFTARPDYKGGYWVVDVDDLYDDTGLVVDVVGSGAVTEYTLEPVNAVADGGVWTRLAFTADSEFQPCSRAHGVSLATDKWGWPAFPEPVRQATAIQANRFTKRRHAPFGVAGSPDMGSELRLLAKVDPDVAVSLKGLVRPRAVG